MSIREEFFITRQGKTFVLYAGLLEEAWERGLMSIDTKLIHAPTTDNNVAIVKAVVELEAEHGATGEYYTERFSGIGDASPENVSRNIAPHLIRMAETRAKARALRDAVNIGATSLEELGEDNPEEQNQPQQRDSSQPSEPERTEGGATRKQLDYLKRLLPEHRRESLEEEHGPIETWKAQAVSKMIDRLQQKQGGEASG